MSDSEFDEVAVEQAAQTAACDDIDDRIADACRGSGNPASLAWLAEATSIGRETLVVDLGSGLGGPAAWIARHYARHVVAVEPASGAVHRAARLFDVPVVRAEAERTRFADDAFDVALVLGVLSVVDDPTAVLREAVRLAPRVGVLDYRTTDGPGRSIGGSWFPDLAALQTWLADAGLAPTAVVDALTPAPPSWQHAGDDVDARRHPDAARSERAVGDAIETGTLVSVLAMVERV